jgi:putative ABC transport system substrate-binding protein
MKKYFYAALALFCVLVSAACVKAPAQAKQRVIGIIQLTDNGAFTDMREGFLDKLKELGYGEAELKIVYKDAQGDMGTLNTICQEMAVSNYDLVVTIATPAAQSFVNQESTIPLVFISVTDPVAAGIMGSMASPDKNATGTSNLVPVDEIFKLAATLTPGIDRYGIVYNTGEANAVSTVAKARAYLDSQRTAYIEATVTNSSEVQQAAESLVSRSGAFFIPIDSMVQSAMPQLARIALDAGLPVYGSSPVMVASGALATVSVGDRYMGGVSATLADAYFKGTPIASIPAVTMDSFITVINKKTAAALGITIPQELSGSVFIGQ